MKWYWKVFIGSCSAVLLVVVLNIGFNLWIRFQLPKLLNRENDTAYTITYKELSISLLNRTILARDVVIVPKAVLKDSLKRAGVFGRIHSIKVSNFRISDLIFSDRIKARSITIEHPKILVYKKDKKVVLKKSAVVAFDKIVSVSTVFLNHGGLTIIETKRNKMLLNVQNINLLLDGVFISKENLDDEIPFHFRNYSFNCDNLYYHPNLFYTIKTKKINATKSDLNIDNFEMLPTYSRREFVARISKERDLNTLLCQTIKVSGMDWGFKRNDFFFHCNRVDLDQVSANVYRSKAPQDDLSKKYLYNKLLRDLKFDLMVDTLQVRNSMVEYEEEKSVEFGTGKISFSRFNATVTTICSGYKKTTVPELKIEVNCIFMMSSPLSVVWKLNVMDRTEGFTIKGKLTNFDAENMVRFTKPYMNVKVTGMMDEVYFNFTGNDQKVTGEFAVKYDDLKFTIFQKDNREKKNKLLTLVAKVFVKKDTKEKVKDTNVELERIPEKSFYNLLWRSVAEGLKKILI